jgi:thiol-disulfide isomerase/thioredoxin
MLCLALTLMSFQQPNAADLIKQIEAIKEPALTDTSDEAIAKWEAECDKVNDRQNEVILKLYSEFPTNESVPKYLDLRWNNMTGHRKPCDLQRLDRIDKDLKTFLSKPQLPANQTVAGYWSSKSSLWRNWKTMLDAKIKATDPQAKPYIESALATCDTFQKTYPKYSNTPWLYYDLTSMTKGSEDEKVGLSRLVKLYPDHRIGKTSKGRLKVLTTLGKPFDLSFEDVLTGKKVSTSDFKGKVIIVDFWATWCNPCRLDIEKNMLKQVEDWKKKGVMVLGISVDIPEDKGGRKMLLDYIKDKQIPWPNFYSGKSVEDGPAAEWGVTAFPTQYLVDKKGNLRYINTNGKREELIEKLLAEE